jgi:hypothetical protein
MKVISTPRTNTVFVADGCGDLPAARFVVDGMELIETAWQPSPEELKLLQDGHPLYLTIWAKAHPPVSLSLESWAAEQEVNDECMD